MDPNVFAYAQILASGGSQPFFQIPQTFPTMGGSQPSTQDTDPEIETVLETQPEPVVEGSKREKRSHKRKIQPLLVEKETTKHGRKMRSMRWHVRGYIYRRAPMLVSV
ncbi:hypothetical protein Hanom_Chr11g01027341 [Helianthus anomalus]